MRLIVEPGGGTISISACIIAHDEESNLPGVLSALDWVDEIILVDCESTDDTAAVARRHRVKIFTRPNLTNLNVNKNFSFDKATSDWLLCLDADEYVSPELARTIKETILAEPVENGFFLTRENTWFGRVLRHGGHFPDRQLRLFRRGKGKFPALDVHERLAVEGRVGTLPVPLSHFPYRTVSQYVLKMDFYTSFEAERMMARGGSFTAPGFFLAMLRAKLRFIRRYVLKAGFLDGWQGFAAASLEVMSRLVVQLKVRDLERARSKVLPEP